MLFMSSYVMRKVYFSVPKGQLPLLWEV